MTNKKPEERFLSAQKRAEACGFRTLESCISWVEGQVGIMVGNKHAIKPEVCKCDKKS